MTAPEDRSRLAMPRLVVAAVLVITLVAAIIGYVLLDDPAADNPPRSSGQPTGPAVDRDAAALALLGRQESALRTRSQADFVATWSGRADAQRRAGTLWSDLSDLGVTRVSLHYLAAEVGGVPLEQQRDLGGSAWTADVEVRWRLAGIDSRSATSTVTYVFVEHAGRVSVVDIRGSSDARDPIWVLGPLDVRRTPRTLAVATSAAEAASLNSHLATAVRDVDQVLRGWRGTLVAYLPATGDQLEALLGSAPGSHAGIAAVTATVDGSPRPDAPVAIMLNPDVFQRLGPTGAHVVVTHEATHVASAAVTADLPLWLAEGFADYVGVGAVDVPLAVAARVALRDVDRRGAPRALPDDGDFGAGSADLEATYELSWLAARLIAERYGERRLVEFYESVVADPEAVGRAFRADLGTTEADFTRQWQQHLERLARDR